MSGVESLEARIERLEARSLIEDLVTRYGMAVDDRDIPAVGELFTEDGRFGHQDEAGVTGRDAIMAVYAERLRGQEYSYHFSHNHLVEHLGADEATGVVNAHAEMGYLGEVLLGAMRYHDRYRRIDGRWHFAERRMSFFYLMPAAELWAGNLTELRKQWPGRPEAADLPQSLPSYRQFIATS